jgi:transposase InsO family protein
MGRRGYPPEFRRRVLDLVAAGRKVVDLARDLGVSSQTIYSWRRQEDIDRGLVQGSGLMPSMGAVGSCFDNALIESFWSRMQVELDRRTWRTRVELATAIFEYLEIFHNRQRRHSALGMLTPVEFETRHQTATVA